MEQPAADPTLVSRLLEEYRANVDLWQHDDNLRQERTANFLQVNGILAVALPALIELQKSFGPRVISALFLSLFGLTICSVWHSIHLRNAEYIRFRRLQLRSIESRLPDCTTFTNTYDAFYRHQPITFAGTSDQFQISDEAKSSSTLSEKNLPRIIGLFWILILVGAIGVSAASLLGVQF